MTNDGDRFTQAVSYVGAFSIFARLLWVPLDEPVIIELAEGQMLDHLLEYCAVSGVDAAAPVGRMRTAVSKDLDEVSMALNVQSTRLFHTAVEKLPAPPYESVWTDGEGLLGGPSTAAVAQAYRAAGVTVAEDVGATLPDHVAREFEFLAHTMRNEARALEADRHDDAALWHERSSRFYHEHLMRWVPLFFEAIISDDSSEFFGGLAETGLALLTADSASSFFSEDTSPRV